MVADKQPFLFLINSEHGKQDSSGKKFSNNILTFIITYGIIYMVGGNENEKI